MASADEGIDCGGWRGRPARSPTCTRRGQTAPGGGAPLAAGGRGFGFKRSLHPIYVHVQDLILRREPKSDQRFRLDGEARSSAPVSNPETKPFQPTVALDSDAGAVTTRSRTGLPPRIL